MALSRLGAGAGVLQFQAHALFRCRSLIIRPVSRCYLLPVPQRYTGYLYYCSDVKKRKSQSELYAWLTKQYEQYQTAYMNALKKFPFLYKVTTVFIKGTKKLYVDCKEGWRVRKLIGSGTPYPDLTWKEMYAIRMMMRDLRTVTPTLIFLSAPIPFWTFIALPLLYLFPRHLLSHQFYQPKQRVSFGHLNHYYGKVNQYETIVKYLQSKMSSVHDPSTSDAAANLLAKLKSQDLIGSADVFNIKQLFAGRFSLQFLPRHQLVSLCHVFTMWPYLQPAAFLQKRLNTCIGQLRYMDIAIKKEGVETLSLEDLVKVCYERGLDSTEADMENLSKWLTDWISISTEISASENSLMLYSAVLLSINHPTNQHHKKCLRKKSTH